jgi:hypothetical protein
MVSLANIVLFSSLIIFMLTYQAVSKYVSGCLGAELLLTFMQLIEGRMLFLSLETRFTDAQYLLQLLPA